MLLIKFLGFQLYHRGPRPVGCLIYLFNRWQTMFINKLSWSVGCVCVGGGLWKTKHDIVIDYEDNCG